MAGGNKCDGLGNGVVEAQKEIARDAEVIISRSHTAERIEKHVDVPVIHIQVTRDRYYATSETDQRLSRISRCDGVFRRYLRVRKSGRVNGNIDSGSSREK